MKQILVAGLALTTVLSAQQVQREVVVRDGTVREDVLVTAPMAAAPMGGAAIEFIAHEGVIAGKVVKNSPFTAEAVSETIQVLADGNRIKRSNSSQLARDSEGRMRRESQLAAFGPFGAAGDFPSFITIDDPVARTHYVLNEKEKTARKMSVPEVKFERTRDPKTGEVGVMFERRIEGPGEAAHIQLRHSAPRQIKAPEKQLLGTRDIEGVKAEGTRSVIRIEAGEVGNERPLEIVSERWYSPELQMDVMTKHSDPRFGETTYRLMRIDRREPPPSLFQVPPDYKVVEGPLMRKAKG